MPPELTVFFTAMIPLLDIKIAIPLGAQLGLSAPSTFLFATTGNLIPAIITLWLIGPITNWGSKHSKFFNKFFDKLFRKTRKAHTKKFNRYGALFLILFVALPIPSSGSATGALIAFLFGVKFWRALGLISLGVISATLLLTAGVTSIFAILDLFS